MRAIVFLFLLPFFHLLTGISACEDTPTPTPTAERCDGIDNNGDGNIDEGIEAAVNELDLTLDLAAGKGVAVYTTCGSGDLQLDMHASLALTGSSVPYSANGSVSVAPGQVFTIQYSFALDGAADSEGFYGSREEGGTFIWPYTAYQVFPWHTGQDLDVTIHTQVTGVPGALYAPEIRDGNVYQWSVSWGEFQSPLHLGYTSEGTEVVWHYRSDDAPGSSIQASQYTLGYQDFLEGLFPGSGAGAVHPVSTQWCPDGETCAAGGMEHEPYFSVSAGNLPVEDDGLPLENTQSASRYFTGLTVIAHELSHGFGVAGLTIRPACVGDLLPFNEGGATFMEGIIRAAVDGLHTEQDHFRYHVGEVDQYIDQNKDLVVWLDSCKETAGSYPANWTTLAYDRGAAFWWHYAQIVGRDVLLGWMVDLDRRARLDPEAYSLTGDELLNDMAIYGIPDPRTVDVVMTDGSSASLVDGWLRTKGARPVVGGAI